MALVLAIEPDSKQAGSLKWVVEHRLRCELVLADSREAAVAALNERIPDLILVSALLSPRDEAEFSEHLRSLDGAEHLQTLTIPLLGSPDSEPEAVGHRLLGGLLRRRKAPAPAGCDPSVYADELKRYLKLAVEGRAERAARHVWHAQQDINSGAFEIVHDDPQGDPQIEETAVEVVLDEPHVGERAIDVAHDEPHVEEHAIDTAHDEAHVEEHAIDTAHDEAHVEEHAIDIAHDEAHVEETVVDAPVVDMRAPREADDNVLHTERMIEARAETPLVDASAAEDAFATLGAQSSSGTDAPEPIDSDLEAAPQAAEPETIDRTADIEPAAVEQNAVAFAADGPLESSADMAAVPVAEEPIALESVEVAPTAALELDDEDFTVEQMETASAVDSVERIVDAEPAAAMPAADDGAPIVEEASQDESPAQEQEEPIIAQPDWTAVMALDPAPVEHDPVVDVQPEPSLDRVVEDLIRPFAASLRPGQSFTFEPVDDPSLDPIVSRESARQVEPAPALVEHTPAPTIEAWMALPAWTETGPPLASHISVGPTARRVAVSAEVHQAVPATQPSVPAADPATLDSRWIASALDALRSDIRLLRTERPPAPDSPAPTSLPQTAARISPPEPAATASKTKAPKRKKEQPPAIQDEWGLYDPSQCGFEALLAALDAQEETGETSEDGEVQPSATDLLMSATSVQAPATAGDGLVSTANPRAGAVRLAPLAMWAHVERESDDEESKTKNGRRHDDLGELLAGLAIPVGVASVSYPTGCTIRRVRMTRDDQPRPPKAAEDPVIILSQRLLKKEREERELAPTSGRR